MHKAVLHLNNENLDEVLKEYENLQRVIAKNQDLLFLKSITNVLEKCCLEQVNHLFETAQLAFKFAQHLNLTEKEKNDLVMLAKYHDIGKVNIKKSILTKPGKLNDHEWQEIKQHPLYSFQILNTMQGLDNVALCALHHHERFDGTGYPAQLAGTSIPLLSRIVSIIDTYEVLTSGRVYKKAVTKQEAIKEIVRCAGTQFDPFIVNEFINFLNKEKSITTAQKTQFCK